MKAPGICCPDCNLLYTTKKSQLSTFIDACTHPKSTLSSSSSETKGMSIFSAGRQPHSWFGRQNSVIACRSSLTNQSMPEGLRVGRELLCGSAVVGVLPFFPRGRRRGQRLLSGVRGGFAALLREVLTDICSDKSAYSALLAPPPLLLLAAACTSPPP